MLRVRLRLRRGGEGIAVAAVRRGEVRGALARAGAVLFVPLITVVAAAVDANGAVPANGGRLLLLPLLPDLIETLANAIGNGANLSVFNILCSIARGGIGSSCGCSAPNGRVASGRSKAPR